MEERFLAAPLDRSAILRSVATLATLLAFLIIVLLIRQILPLITVLAVPILVVPALAFSAAPIGYRLTETTLIIDRKTLPAIRVPFAQIAACHPLPRTHLAGAIRMYGTGGLFGWAGRYRASGLGAFTMHATNLDRLVLVRRRRGKPLVISPVDPVAFIQGLQRQYETIVLPPSSVRGRVR
jgi:hypothetical protein